MRKSDHSLYLFWLLVVLERRIEKKEIINELDISNATFYRHLKKIDLFLAEVSPGRILSKCEITKLYFIQK